MAADIEGAIQRLEGSIENFTTSTIPGLSTITGTFKNLLMTKPMIAYRLQVTNAEDGGQPLTQDQKESIFMMVYGTYPTYDDPNDPSTLRWDNRRYPEIYNEELGMRFNSQYGEKITDMMDSALKAVVGVFKELYQIPQAVAAAVASLSLIPAGVIPPVSITSILPAALANLQTILNTAGGIAGILSQFPGLKYLRYVTEISAASDIFLQLVATTIDNLATIIDAAAIPIQTVIAFLTSLLPL